MPAFVAVPDGAGPHPAVIVLMEAFGLDAYRLGVAQDRWRKRRDVDIHRTYFKKGGEPMLSSMGMVLQQAYVNLKLCGIIALN